MYKAQMIFLYLVLSPLLGNEESQCSQCCLAIGQISGTRQMSGAAGKEIEPQMHLSGTVTDNFSRSRADFLGRDDAI